MNDFLNGKNGKIKVMYVRSDENNTDSHAKKFRRGKNRRHDHERVKIDTNQIDPIQLQRQRAEEKRIYGKNACQQLFKNRPEIIVKAWFSQASISDFRMALKWMADHRKAYHVVDSKELATVSGTEHHEGVCFLVKKSHREINRAVYLQQAPAQDCVLALENIGNPHNLGGIMRTCAHFGIHHVLLHDPAMLESGAAMRTAEGGAEHIKAIHTDDLLSALVDFRKAGYSIVMTSSHKGSDLTNTKLPNKIVLVLGQESGGITKDIWQQGDIAVSILGTGLVESLNVSVATGILLAEWRRQNRRLT
ncbi:rRNA methylase [Candidatus Regiella insecticola 5.15]|uniref:rRNA methylase n=1 Tax=Candidatus Regiella insecticola 5.15 TaxID=1005043 RepID=G2GZP5_9ENTR|nr:tRNA/rRNA methyltransferase [Candidatus Regiella insecticola]EGY28802.1 rRNA methylase [Candidatus Regiella insecticola 5.15]